MTNGAPSDGTGAGLSGSAPSIGREMTPSIPGSKTRLIIAVIVAIAVLICGIGAYFHFSGGGSKQDGLDGLWKSIHLKQAINNITTCDEDISIGEQATIVINGDNVSGAPIVTRDPCKIEKVGTNQWIVTDLSLTGSTFSYNYAVITLNGDTLTLMVSINGNWGQSPHDILNSTYTYERVTS